MQEVEPLDGVNIIAGDTQPTFRERVADPAFPRRAIGMFSYTDTNLRAVDLSAPLFSFRRYEASRGSLHFNVVAVWPWQTKSSKTAYRQAHEGLSRYQDWIRERPTVVLGDFTANASFKGRNWTDLYDLLQSLQLVSTYHRYFNEEPGKEKIPTHFHRGRQEAAFHLDYCFISKDWVKHVKKVDVGTYAEWHTISDHAPLVVDLDL